MTNVIKTVLRKIGVISSRPTLYKYLKMCAIENREPRRDRWIHNEYNNADVKLDKELLQKYVMVALGENTTWKHTENQKEFLTKFWSNVSNNSLYVSQGRDNKSIQTGKHYSWITYSTKTNSATYSIEFCVKFKQSPTQQPESSDRIYITYRKTTYPNKNETKNNGPIDRQIAYKDIDVHSDMIAGLPDIYE